jgi:small subunit ribosomal protein S15
MLFCWVKRDINMSLNKKEKEKIIKDNQRMSADTGSPEVQVALLSERITALTDHLKVHRKDFHSRRGLLQMVNKRRRLLNYLKFSQNEKYINLVKKLKIKG